MVVDIHKLIAAINPDVYLNIKDKPELKSQVKKWVKEEGYIEAAKKIEKLPDYEPMEFENIYYVPATKAAALGNPVEKHFLSYDIPTAGLEKTYFWILDFIEKEFQDLPSKQVDKLIDNFVSSPGSAHFSEFGGKATKMQDEAAKMLGAANQVVKSVINLLYDLKEFKMRLSIYDDLKSKNEADRRAALINLKQIWMDTVDMKRGNSAIKAMAQNFEFVTLIDAFMVANSVEDVTKPADKGGMDLNDRVKRLLAQRVEEFFKWLPLSEKELRKRFEIEKNYLRSQVNTVHLYARWAKPYLKAARDLEQRATPNAHLINLFNSSLFELKILARGKYDVIADVKMGELPKIFEKLNTKKFSPYIVVEFNFRSIPERTQQGGYGYRGKADITFTSYALSEKELAVLKKCVEDDDLGDLMTQITGATDESLGQLKEEIDEFLNEEPEEKKNKEEETDTNPFSALFSFLKTEKKEEKKKDKKEEKIGPKTPLEPDNPNDKIIRSQAALTARKACRKLYESFKKDNNMPGFPTPFPM